MIGASLLLDGSTAVSSEQLVSSMLKAAILAHARRHWQGTTLLCVTHDVGETLGFERVLVVEGGHIVEDGPPRDLAADAGSRYRALLDAEQEVREGLWASAAWRRLRMETGNLSEEAPE